VHACGDCWSVFSFQTRGGTTGLVELQYVAPASKGLFRAAISESGGLYAGSLAQAFKVTDEVAATVGCVDKATGHATKECMTALDPLSITNLTYAGSWGPVVRGCGAQRSHLKELALFRFAAECCQLPFAIRHSFDQSCFAVHVSACHVCEVTLLASWNGVSSMFRRILILNPSWNRVYESVLKWSVLNPPWAPTCVFLGRLDTFIDTLKKAGSFAPCCSLARQTDAYSTARLYVLAACLSMV
jgi:hypothetical protein